MELRNRTTHVLAAAGALLIVGTLSLSGGVAIAVPGPAAEDGATTSSSRPKAAKQKQKQKKSTTTTEKTGTDDSEPSRPARSTSTTATTATTRPPTTGTTAPTTSSTTAPARPTAPPPAPTATTAPAQTAPQQVDPDADRTTDGADPAPADEPVDPSTEPPAARSDSGLPPGMYPAGPGTRAANSTPAATVAPAPATTVTTPPATVTPDPTEPAREGSGTISEAGVSDSVTDSLIEPGVGDRDVDPSPARAGQRLGETGDGTRRLMLLGGVALLLGALVVAFTGRDRPARQPAGPPAGPGRRPRPRRELDGWEDGVPLAPAKRELVRQRLGISGGRSDAGLPGGGPGA